MSVNFVAYSFRTFQKCFIFFPKKLILSLRPSPLSGHVRLECKFFLDGAPYGCKQNILTLTHTSIFKKYICHATMNSF